MTPIRLAVRHPEEPVFAGIAARLRNAIAEPIADFSEVTSHFQAVMIGNVDDWSVVERLLSQGLHILIVANPCPPREVISRGFDRADQTGVVFAVENPDRFLPSRQLIRAQLFGPLGEPALVRIHRWESDSTIRSIKVSGLPEPLLRELDLALWLFGRRAERVYAHSRNSDERDRLYFQIHLGFASGGMALLDYANRLPAFDGYQSLSVIAARSPPTLTNTRTCNSSERWVHVCGTKNNPTNTPHWFRRSSIGFMARPLRWHPSWHDVRRRRCRRAVNPFGSTHY